MGKFILVIPQLVRYPFKIANFVFNLTVIVTPWITGDVCSVGSPPDLWSRVNLDNY